MSHAEKCPVCGGKGFIPDSTKSVYNKNTWPKCHGCKGKGWVSVSDYPNPNLPRVNIPSVFSGNPMDYARPTETTSYPDTDEYIVVPSAKPWP